MRTLLSLLALTSVALAQTNVDQGYAAHGQSGNISRFDPILDEFLGEASGSGIPVDFFTYPRPTNGDRLILTRAGAEIETYSLNSQALLSTSSLTSTATASIYVNNGVLQEHIAVIQPFSGSSSNIIEFVNPISLSIMETKAGGALDTDWVDIEATYNDLGTPATNDDLFYYWLANKETNGGVNRISAIKFTWAQANLSNGNPFDPNPPNPGPPFPNVLTQLDQNPGVYFDVTTFSNLVGELEIEAWQSVGVNYIIVCWSQQVNFNPPRYDVNFTFINADTETNLGTLALGNPLPEPPFRHMHIANQYLMASSGNSVSGSGGNRVDFVYLPQLVTLNPAALKATVFLTGVTDMAANIDQDKVYLGTDEQNNLVNVQPVDLANPTNPLTGPLSGFNLLTAVEANTLNPPFRAYPFKFAFSRTSSNPVVTFPSAGAVTSSSGGDTCGSTGLDLLIPVIALMLYRRRKAARR